jgi:hypothetical protein
MKILPQIKCLAPTLVGFALSSSFAFAQEQSGKVKITDTRVEIHPGSQLSQSDIDAIDAKLKKFDKSLYRTFYRIDTYQNGKLTKSQGNLSEQHLDKMLAAEVKSARARGFTVRTQQVVNTSSTSKSQQPPPPTGPIAFTPQKEKEVVKQVAPILKKYSNH